jgi:hypothetical protein
VSSDIQNKNNAIISDYNNSFITSNLDYSKQDSPTLYFSHTIKTLTKTGLGNRQTNNQKETTKKATQFF